MSPYTDALWRILFQTLLTIVLVFGSIGFATGVGLIVSSSGTLRFLRFLNRWFSFRSSLKPVEVNRDVEQSMRRHRYWIGVPLVMGGLVSMLAMALLPVSFSFGERATDGGMELMLATAAASLRWLLIIGGALGVAIGLMLCLWPDVLGRIELHANRWTSTRQMLRGSDDMHPLLDDAVTAHPERSGWVLAVFGLMVSAGAAALLLARA